MTWNTPLMRFGTSTAYGLTNRGRMHSPELDCEEGGTVTARLGQPDTLTTEEEEDHDWSLGCGAAVARVGGSRGMTRVWRRYAPSDGCSGKRGCGLPQVRDGFP